MRSLSIPFKLVNLQDNGFHILMEIVVFKEQHHVVIDTGASRSVFDKALLEKHMGNSLNEIELQQASTLFGSSSALVGTIPELQIGSLKIKNYETVALDLQSVSDTYLQLDQPALAGIIGGDILVQYQCQINYLKKLIRFYH